MSHRKLPKKRDDNQTVITEFTSNKNIEEIQEKVKQLKLTVSKQERVKPSRTPENIVTSSKKRTPPLLEKEDIAKKLHFEINPKLNMQNPGKENNMINKGNTSEDHIIMKMEQLLQPIKDSIENLEKQWTEHRDEIKQLREENCKLERRVKSTEHQN